VIAVLVLSALPLLLIVAAMKDATSMTIPNWIPLAAGAAFLVLAPFELAPSDIGMHLLVAMGALVAGFAMFALHWVGGGDAKLLAAAALWLGLSATPEFLLWTGLAGGGLSLGLLAARRAALYLPFAAPYASGDGALARLLAPKGDIPYGLAIAAGGLAAFPSSALFLAAVGG
jgi:prepilin peptidase CpaA